MSDTTINVSDGPLEKDDFIQGLNSAESELDLLRLSDGFENELLEASLGEYQYGNPVSSKTTADPTS